jgi:gas vesicle protein
MADGYDRFDNEGSGGGSFVMGLLTGTVLGAGLGMLFAPKSGADLRNQISEQAGNLANTASEGYRRATESANEWAEKGRGVGRDIYGKAREAVAKGTEEAQRYVNEATGGAAPAAAGSGTDTGRAAPSSYSGSSFGAESVRGGGSGTTGSTYGGGSETSRGSGNESGPRRS